MITAIAVSYFQIFDSAFHALSHIITAQLTKPLKMELVLIQVLLRSCRML